jgi:hypothetical protein
VHFAVRGGGYRGRSSWTQRKRRRVKSGREIAIFVFLGFFRLGCGPIPGRVFFRVGEVFDKCEGNGNVDYRDAELDFRVRDDRDSGDRLWAV